MDRLTFKSNGCYGSIANEHIIVNKLGQLEDVEKELGIDLITLFKANKKIWIKNKDGSFEEIKHYYEDELTNYVIDLGSKAIRFTMYGYELCGDEYLFSNYGKTWALTREELERWMTNI